MSLAGMILTMLGGLICTFCIIALIYIDCTWKSFLRMDKSFYIILMGVGCVCLVIVTLFDFSKMTVFNALIWMMSLILWTETK